MRSPKKRSLLGVNEHFEGEHNDKIHFLFSLILYYENLTINYKLPKRLLVLRIIFIVDLSSTKIEFSPCCSCAGSPV